MPSTRAVAAREAIAKIARSGADPHELLHEVSVHVRTVVPYDYGGTLLLDHATLLPTGRMGPVVHPELSRSLLRNEVLTPDVHKFADLARQPHPVAARGELSPDAAERSARLGSITYSVGLSDEVRVVFRAAGSTWGGACFSRAADEPPFGDEQLRFLADVANDVGRGLRASLARRAEAAGEQQPPGVLLIDETLEVVSETPAARRWRAQMAAETLMAIHAVALSAQHYPENERTRRARVRLRSGEWLVLHAAPIADSSGRPGLTAVTLSPIPRLEQVSLLLRLHGLSAREREVTELLLQGMSTDATAAGLYMSRHTVRDHLKSVFAKVGVTSRPELMAVLSGDAPAEAEAASAR